MILGIDAFNIRTGGCLTHLTEVLRVINPSSYGFKKVIIWGNVTTLAKIDDRDWLYKIHVPLLDRTLPFRLFWHRFLSCGLVSRAECTLLFVPGGSDSNGFSPVVTMSQNMLPFEWREIWRYKSPIAILRLLLIRSSQIGSFKKARGIIFLTKYARDAIFKITGEVSAKSVIIPHGISRRFFIKPRSQFLVSEFSENRPCRILYVSALYAYKHQWKVAEAIALLRDEGIPVILDLVGPPAEGVNLLNATMERIDPLGSFIIFHGSVAYERLNEYYVNADIGVFASSCENMPNILLENMASGLPIACSSMGPMPEILGDAGVYFNPCDSKDIAATIRKLMYSANLRNKLAKHAYDCAQQYSWQRCAEETFTFLADIAKNKNNKFKKIIKST